MVHEMDKYIGQIIDYLKIAKQYDNTVIIFLSDGGITKMEATQFTTIDNSLENLGAANSIVALGTNWESLKLGNKGNQIKTDFENTIKAPLIIRSPLLIGQEGSRDKKQRTVLDITPTILKLINLPHPSENYFEEALVLEGKSIF